jgi:hypothetical protein
MSPLRILLLVAAAAALVAAAVLPRPAVFAPLALAGLVLFVVGAGSAAADAFPFRPVAFACSLAAMPLGVLLVVRGPDVMPLVVAALATASQVAPILRR